MCFDTGYADTNTATARLPKTGVYDVRVYVRHRWVETSQLFEKAFEIGEPVRFVEDASRLNIDQTKRIISADETRTVTLVSEDPTIVRVSGRSATGLQTGSTFIVATAAQDEGKVVTRIPVEVCIPVDSVELPGRARKPVRRRAGRAARLRPAPRRILPAGHMDVLRRYHPLRK